MAWTQDDLSTSAADQASADVSLSDTSPFSSRLGLRGKSVIFAVSVFVVVGAATLWAMGFVGERIAGQLGAQMAERHVLWHKERVLGAVNRELALAKKMAESETLLQWAVAESDPRTAAHARSELQSFHDTFSARSYFVGLTGSQHFFYADENAERIALTVVDTLSRDDEDDTWFFNTIADPAPFNLNVDHNVELGVTNLWINYAMRNGGETLGVVGTGVRLSGFIDTFIEQSERGLGAMMIDASGFIQAHQDPAMVERNAMARTDASDAGIWSLLESDQDRAALRQGMAKLKAETSDSETLFLTIAGTHLLVSVAYLAPLDWYTLAMMDPGAVIGTSEIAAVAGLLSIALVLTVIVLVIAQNDQVIRPLLQLTRGAERMAKGDYDVRLPVVRRDEIGYLTRSFNDLAAIIADYTQSLESKVEDRTRDVRTREARLRAIIDNTVDGIVTIDDKGIIETFSPAAEKLFGYASDDVIGQNVSLLMPEPDRGRHDHYVDNYMTTGEATIIGISREVMACRKDGREFPAELAVADSSVGDERRFTGIIRDITERKRAEQAMRESEQRLLAILEASPIGVSMIDTKSKARRFVNTSVLGMFGVSSLEDLDSISMSETFADPKDYERLIADLDAGDSIADNEVARVRLDGTQWWTLQSSTTAEYQGNTVYIIWSLDITKRKQAEDEARRAQQQTMAILTESPIGVTVTDTETGRLTFANRRSAELFGLSEEDLANSEARQFYADPQERSAVMKAFDERGELRDHEVRMRRADGSEIWDLMTLAPFEYEQQPSLLSWHYDITELKRAEQELAGKEALLRAALDNMSDGIFVVDEEFRFLTFNQRYIELFEFPDKMVEAGQSFRDVLVYLAEAGRYGPGDSAAQVNQRLESIRNRASVSVELALPGNRFVELRQAALEAGGAVGVVTDITERKRAEDEARRAQQQTMAILTESPIGVTVTNTETGRLAFANRRSAELFGLSEEELANSEARHFYADPQERSAVMKAFDERGELRDHEVRMRRADGSEIWDLMTLTPFEYEQQPSLLSWHYDITERKRTEQELAGKEALLRATLDNMSDGIFVVDSKLNYVLFNAQYLELVEFPPDVISVGASFLDALEYQNSRGDFGPSGDDAKLRQLAADYQSGEPVLYERELHSGRIIEFRRTPVPDGGAVGVLTDITKRKRAEQALTDAYEVISSSIQYASRIQRSTLPDSQVFQEMLSEYFVHWQPCNEVGGDIYWHRRWGDGDLIILADCTGHGVPGAFMTLIAGGALDQALGDTPPGDCAALIQRMHQLIQRALGQERGEGYADDGLELGVCFLPRNRSELRFAGAHLSLYIQENGTVRELKGDRTEIGYRSVPQDAQFTNHSVQATSGMGLFMTTDGLPSQVGEKTRLPFSKRGFVRLLESLHDVSMTDKGKAIMAALQEHLGDEVQRDDISLIGFELRAKL